MTVSTTQNTQLSGYNIVKQAMQRATVLGAGREPDGADVTMFLGMLVTNLQEWQSKDAMLSNVSSFTLTFTAGTASYTTATGVPSGLLQIRFPGSVRLSSGTDEVLEQISFSEYTELSDKTESGTPYQVLVDHTSTGPRLTFYRVPDASVVSATFYYHRSLFDGGSGNTLDLKAQFQKAAIVQLAGDVAAHYKKTFRSEKLYRQFDDLYKSAMIGAGDDNDMRFEF